MYRMARGSDAWVCVVGCFVTAQCGKVPSSWGLSETGREGHADDIGFQCSAILGICFRWGLRRRAMASLAGDGGVGLRKIL